MENKEISKRKCVGDKREDNLPNILIFESLIPILLTKEKSFKFKHLFHNIYQD